MGETERLHHPGLRYVFGPRLHHDDGVVGSGYDEIQRRPVQIGEGRAEHELIVHETDAHGADRSVEGEVGYPERGRGPADRQDVGIVLAIRGQQQTGDLRFTAPATWKQRPQRTVDQAAGEDFLLVGPSLPLEEPPRNPARRVEALAIVHRQRQEIDVRPVASGRRHRGEHDGVTQAHGYRTGCLPGEPTGFNDQIVIADPGLYRFNQLSCSFSDAGILLGFAAFAGLGGSPACGRALGLLSEAEGSDQGSIPLHVFPPQIVQQPSAPADHAEQAPPRGVVLPMIAEVARQSGDPRRQKRDLNLR